MELSFDTRIQLLEHIQELHQKMDSPCIHWLDAGQLLMDRHFKNLPRLRFTPISTDADIHIGSLKAILNTPYPAHLAIVTDGPQPSTELISNLTRIGYSHINGRLFRRVRLPQLAKDKLRVLVVTNLYPPQELGGYGRSIFDFSECLRQFGHAIYVVTSNAEYLGGDISSEEGVCRDLILLGSYENEISLIDDPRRLRQIRKSNKQLLDSIIRRIKPNVALLGNLDMLGSDCIYQLLGKAIPCFHHYGFSHPSMIPFHPSEIPPAIRGYHPIANSHFTAKSLGSVLNEFSPLPVIYPGAQTTFYKDIQPKPLGGPLRIAYAGLLIAAKGPHILLQALACLHLNNIPFSCEIAGGHISDNFRVQLLAYIQNAGIADKVSLLGKLERRQMIELFSRNQIFVFPSTWEEPFGISQVEALAAGLLVVSSGTGGAGETVHDDVNGRRFRPSDSQHLAEVLSDIFYNPEQHEPLRRRGRNLAQSHFDTSRESRKLSNLMLNSVSSSHDA